MIRRTMTLLAVSALVLFSASCSDDEPERDDGGAIVEEGSLGVFNLVVGDCFDDPSAVAEGVSDLAAVPCDQPHDNEVFALFDSSASEFPGEPALQEEASEQCLARFVDYVERDYETSALDIGVLWPTQASWDRIDDREIVCYLFSVDGSPLTGSMRSSGI